MPAATWPEFPWNSRLVASDLSVRTRSSRPQIKRRPISQRLVCDQTLDLAAGGEELKIKVSDSDNERRGLVKCILPAANFAPGCVARYVQKNTSSQRSGDGPACRRFTLCQKRSPRKVWSHHRIQVYAICASLIALRKTGFHFSRSCSGFHSEGESLCQTGAPRALNRRRISRRNS
jgi:hypothetical protein